MRLGSAIGVLGVLLVAVIVAVPPVIGSLLTRALRMTSGDGGPSSNVDAVSFAWPARLHLEGLQVRLTAAGEPAVAVPSADVRIAPLGFLLGEEFLDVTVTGPRVVLTRRPDGTYDLLAHQGSDAAEESASPSAWNADARPADLEDATGPDPATLEPDTSAEVQPETNATGAGDHPSIDASLWTRNNDPFTVMHGTLTIADGELSIVDPALGQRTELHDVTLALRVQPDEVIAFGVSARQRGREGREGTVTATGRLALASGVRFWSDPVEILRRVELDMKAEIAPCVVGDVDGGGEIRATVHEAHATLAADGSLNGGTVSVRSDTRVTPGSRTLAGDLRVELRNVGLCSAFAPLLAPLNPIFDVENGTLAGRLDTTWSGGWSASPAGRQRSRLQGRIGVKDLAVSDAPLTTALLHLIGAPGGELAGDLVASDVRSENGRLSYDRMALTGRDPQLTFAGSIAEDGVLHLTCDVWSRRLPDRYGGTPLRVPIVGWVDDPRLVTPADGAGKTSSSGSFDGPPR